MVQFWGNIEFCKEEDEDEEVEEGKKEVRGCGQLLS